MTRNDRVEEIRSRLMLVECGLRYQTTDPKEALRSALRDLCIARDHLHILHPRNGLEQRLFSALTWLKLRFLFCLPYLIYPLPLIALALMGLLYLLPKHAL